MRSIAIVVLTLSFGIAACDRSPEATSEAVVAAESSALAVVDANQVCMVNDQFMGRAQIPVEIEGRTYYGCCAMCKDKLANQPSARTATDPVTGQLVDKAAAVIGRDLNGRVFYFESEQTLRKFRG